VARLGWRLTAIILAVSLVAAVAFACVTLGSRPLENTEGCLLFEASRIRRALPLYTDPIVGAYDYGAVPARYYVLYPPLWSHLLALFPEGRAAAVARAMSALAWYGVLGSIAWGAHRRGRPAGVISAAFVGGVYTLALYGASARPDSLAVALAAMALERSVRATRAGLREGALFALAAWMKPNVVGLGVGAVASQVVAPMGVLAGWSSVSALTLAVLLRESRGLFWHHLVAATGQSLSFSHWVEQVGTRAPFFLMPIGFALYCGTVGRADRGVRIATLALATSLAWTLVSLAKIGSATCYWMEPCVAAVIVCAHAPVPHLAPRMRSGLALAALLQAFLTGTASVRSSIESILASQAKARVLADLRASLRGSELMLSDDAGVEFAIDARLIDTPFQTTQLVRRGSFPREAWLADVGRPEIVAVVATSDLLDKPLGDVDLIHDRYDVELRRFLRDQFTLARRDAGYSLYSRR
jgi:hypothetical protein